MAIELLYDSVEAPSLVPEAQEARADPLASPSSNPIAIAIPLLMVGAVMVILFPPVGLLLFAAAGAMVAWGLVSMLFRR